MAQRNRGRFRKEDRPYPTVADLYEKSKPNFASAGGFLPEDEDESEEGPSERRQEPQDIPDFTDPAYNIDIEEVKLTDAGYPICLQCSSEFPTSFYYDHFGHPLCDTCRKEHTEERKLMTRTEAKDQFLLKDPDLDRREPLLRYISRKNPHNPHWGDMKLYLRSQVWKRALEVWGSGEQLMAAKEKRATQKEERKEKQFENKLKALRKQVRGEAKLRRGTVKPHTHVFGPEEFDAAKDVYSKKCTLCDHKETYEKL